MDDQGPPSAAHRHHHLLPAADEVLATGWEPGGPVGDTVVRNYQATLVDRLTAFARRGGGRVEVIEAATFVDSASAYVFDNVAVCHGPLDSRRMAAVAAAGHRFFPAGRAWTLLSFTPTVAPPGMELVGHPPLMYRPASPALVAVDGGDRSIGRGAPGGPLGRARVEPMGGDGRAGRLGGPPWPPGLEVRRVRCEADLADFESTLVAAYPLPAGSAVVSPSVLDGPFAAWVGYVDGQPVATAGSHTAFGLTEVEWVSTLASHRGRGIGAALTWAATTVEPEAAAVLIATDDGRPVYERLGYLALQRLTMWLSS